MAGGIDWFRWHHGSVSDGKFALVAHKAGASVAEVIAVWACLLEAASAAEDRGNPGAVDFEAMDFSLGMADGKSWRIYERMRERALLDGGSGRIASWEKRQPKREDDTAAERKRRQRERDHELKLAACVTAAESRTVTHGHAQGTHGHDRGEERREENNSSEPNGSGASAPPTDREVVFASGVAMLTAAGITDKNARSFLAGQCKEHGEASVRAALDRCAREQPIQPVPWLQATLKASNGARAGPSKSDALMSRNVAVLQRFAERP